jgi:uncharacterized membrane protein
MYLLITGVAHALYVLLLAHSYQLGDLSIVYPIARGSSVVFVSLFSGLIVPHYTLSGIGSGGIVIVLAGIGAMAVKGQELHCGSSAKVGYTSINSEGRNDAGADEGGDGASNGDDGASSGGGASGDDDSMSQKQILTALAFALAVGACTAVYSIDDSVGVTMVDPLLYQCGNCTIMFAICIPFMLASSERRSGMVEAVRSKKKYIVGIGIGGAGTYLIVLYAFRMADNAPFVVVLRQSSIVFATMLGVLLLKEPLTIPKLVGVLLITAGVTVIDFSDGG